MRASAGVLLFAGILLAMAGCLLAAYAFGLSYLLSYEGPGNGALPTAMGVLSVVILAVSALLFRKGWRLRKVTVAWPRKA